MARPLRILVEGGWYHVTARGNRRERLFFDDTDRRRFLGRVAELPERSELEVHAFVLMNNHYHLPVRTHKRPARAARLMKSDLRKIPENHPELRKSG